MAALLHRWHMRSVHGISIAEDFEKSKNTTTQKLQNTHLLADFEPVSPSSYSHIQVYELKEIVNKSNWSKNERQEKFKKKSNSNFPVTI